MLLHKLLKRYTHLSIFTKLLIPQITALFIGIIYIIYTYHNISIISSDYTTIKEKMIPALEKSKTNVMLLKQIANDFTFATLSSEIDFLESTKQYNTQILDNLSSIGSLTHICTIQYQNTYKKYFKFTYTLTQKLIETEKETDKNIEKVLTYYQKTNQNFIQLNHKVKQSISNQTTLVSSKLKAFHTDVLLFGIILYFIITLITFFIYKGLQHNFFKLISEISSIRQSGMIKEKIAEFSKNEFGILAKELNAVFADFNEAYQNLEDIANKDKLTQLYNRLYIDKKIQEIIGQKKCFGIIIVDIDHFKQVNDTYGHITGDNILKSFASVLQTSLPQRAIISRWGGEEFLILIPQCHESSTLKIYAESARKAIEKYSFDNAVKITASFGIVIHKTEHSFQETLSRADQALYQAKESGRNCIKSNNG